jgi:metalloendopeptidase OMA1, mitochondrial
MALLAGAVLLGILSGCVTEPITGRQQFMLTSSGSETQMGFSEFEKMKRQVPVSTDAAAKALVERVGRRIAAVAEMPNPQWEFVLFESKEANAFCLPGGKVGIYTGILPITQTEEGLATVMGHEVAHALARHGGERMSVAMGLQTAGAIAGVATSQSKYGALFQQLYAPATQLGVTLPHTRTQESSADEIGVVLMARAGYRPAAAVGFWQRFADFNRRAGANTPWFLRTHPLDEQRIANIQRLLPKAEAEFRAP